MLIKNAEMSHDVIRHFFVQIKSHELQLALVQPIKTSPFFLMLKINFGMKT